MSRDHKETFVEHAVDKLKDLAGLPPGRFADGEPKPSSDGRVPTGGLTSDDAQGLPPHQDVGTGIKSTE